ncbi:MAG TPA: PRC-barrel domain-containing protein, partial [Hyphomicrobiaceae bacterium]|nr:PRC-barrel domain-containing protein [Hyphomicrobiaceae bacterium]
ALSQDRSKSMKISTASLMVLLAVGPAIAQTTKGTQQDPGAPSGSMQASQNYTRQGDEIRASRLVGAPVRNDADERIGEVNEVVLTKDGKVAAVVVGVGGFLGIGERDVALAFPSVRIEPDTSTTARAGSVIVKVDLTKDTLSNAPAWDWAEDGGTTPAPQTNPTTK